MAHFYMSGVDDILKELARIGAEIDDVSREMVDEAADIMDSELKREIKSATTKYGTGVLAESISHEEPVKNAWGYFTTSTARGRDTKRGRYKKVSHAAFNKKTGAYVGHRKSYGSGAVRNHDKLYYLEFGSSRQAPHPIVQKCVNGAEGKVLEKMQEIFERATGI